MNKSTIILTAYNTAKNCRNALEFLERFGERIHSEIDVNLGQMVAEYTTAQNKDASLKAFFELVALRMQFDRAWQKTFAFHRGRYDDEHSAALTFHNNFNIEAGE